MIKRIMLVVTGLNMGGAEMQVKLLASEFRNSGFEVCVVSLIRPIYFVSELRDQGVDVFSLDMTPGVASLSGLLKYINLVFKWRPDIIHSHMYHANIFARVGRLFYRKIPLVSTAHNINEFDSSRLRYFLYKNTKRLSSFMTNVSVAAYDYYVEKGIIDERHGCYLPNGIDLEAFKNLAKSDLLAELDKDTFKWIAVGRLALAKDYPNLIGAVELLAREDKKFKVFIIGDGDLATDLKKTVAEKGLSRFICFTGIRKDIPSVMAAADGFVMSSSWEGLPMVLLEAMASKLPIVATDVGGNKQLVTGANAGFVVRKSASDLLAKAMSDVMAMTEQQRSDIGGGSFDYVSSNFQISVICKRWLDIYQSFVR